MPDISKITLPSGSTYDLKDATAREMIAGGISFIIAWNGSSTPVVANIPAGVQVKYNGTTYTGTLAAEGEGGAQPGAFYLVASGTTPSGEPVDAYDEYVPVGETGSKTWEKIGDTQVDLSDVVTDVTLNKQTASFVTGYPNATSASVIGADSTFTVTQPTVTVTPSTTNVKATASGAATAWNSKDAKTVVTGYSNVSTDTFVKSVSAESDKNLVTTTVTGVSGSTTASKATEGTSQTTATGAGTSSSVNTDWLKGISVANETLTIGAATLNTQTTTQFTFSNVTVPVAASSATTVATGQTSTSGTGAAVVTGISIGTSGTAVTDLGTPSTASVIGESSTFKMTQPTVALATGATAGTGVISVATGISSASASGGNVAWNSKDSKTAITGLGTASTGTGLTNSTSITVTKGTNS